MNAGLDATAARPTGKVWLRGTHRACSPAETLRRIGPLLPRMGITRLADITWLDEIGLPVYQAVRPNSYMLSVSQGKGVTPKLAKASAAMEAVEGWHAERPAPAEHTGTVGDLAGGLGYRVDELELVPRHHLNPALRLDWSRARRLRDGGETLVPTDYVRLDGRVGDRWTPRLFATSTNGLASGNTLEEAALHGLYEVIERDALASAVAPQPVALETVDGVSREVLDLLRRAGVEVLVERLHSPTALACFNARIHSDMFPAVFEGSGCHLDRDVALCRALTEAAQSRLTTIAGARDDMSARRYQRTRPATERQARRQPTVASSSTPELSFGDVASLRTPGLAGDLRLVVDRVLESTGRDPLVVDHTRPELGIPVVHVVCPRMRNGA